MIVPAGIFVMLKKPKRHMGTISETIQLQETIKQMIGELGWSQNQLARNIYTEIHEIDDEDEILNFQERVKKELQRSTTKPDKLRKYLSIICNHHEAERIDVALSKHVPLGYISESLSKKMKVISQEADKASNNGLHGTSSLTRRRP
jgi:nitrate/nitrite-specific signal transduction histidine kinase